MSVMVTGATGFLGRRLVRLVREDGVQVRCLVRPSSDVEPLRRTVGETLWSGVEVLSAELMDIDRCRDAMRGCSIVYHVAAGLSGSTSTLFLSSVVPTRRVMRAAAAERVQRFVLVSSLGVYGTRNMRAGSVLDEQSPIDPYPHLRDPYTYSKVMQERAAREIEAETGLPLVIVRPGVIIGPGRGVLSARIGLQLGPLMVRMGGTQQLPYTYVDNCAAAIRQAGLAEGIDGEVYNVIDDDLPSAKGLLRMCRRAGHPVKSVWVPRPLIQPMAGTYDWYHRWSRGQLPGVLTPYRTASIWKPLKYTNKKAKAQLGWQPDISFDEAFRRSLPSSEAVD